MQDLVWFKSSYSANGQSCVECARMPDGGMAIRDSKDREGPVLFVTHSEWRLFVAGVTAGEFDLLA